MKYKDMSPEGRKFHDDLKEFFEALRDMNPDSKIAHMGFEQFIEQCVNPPNSDKDACHEGRFS